MTKTILLLRHAKSSWSAADAADFDRPLAPRGRAAAPAMAALMRSRGWQPERVLCSAAARTRETWALMAPAFGGKVPVRYVKELYLAPPVRILRRLRRLPDTLGTVLVIGHNPGLQELAAGLSAMGDSRAIERLNRKFPTAALAVIASEAAHWRDLGPATLAAFIRPKDLAQEEAHASQNGFDLR